MEEDFETNGESGTKTFFNLVKKTKTINTYNVYITQSIFMSEDLYRLLDILRETSKDDIVRMYINSPGGRMDTTLSVLHAMDECKAKIITIADGKVASAATFLFLAGDEYVIYDFSYFMFHQYSGGVRGKGGEMKERVDFTFDHYEKFFNHYYGSLFSKKDIKKMLNGKDKWIGKVEMEALLKKGQEKIDKNKDM